MMYLVNDITSGIHYNVIKSSENSVTYICAKEKKKRNKSLSLRDFFYEAIQAHRFQITHEK